MSNSYLSKKEFERKCPCAMYLDSYANMQTDKEIEFLYCHIEELDNGTNYIATYTSTSDNKSLIVSCTVDKQRNYSYKVIQAL